MRRTRETLADWHERPWPVIRTWLGGSLAAGTLLLAAVWLISILSSAHGRVWLHRPPFAVGGQADVLRILSSALHVSAAQLLIALLPHALPELAALFLPLAAWIVASRRGEWHQLLAATIVTVGIAVPTLVITATWEVYVAPHVVSAVL